MASPDKPSFILGSISDPTSTFRHMVETQRNAALAHEELLVFQLQQLDADLRATRNVIASCDAALATLTDGSKPAEPMPPAEPLVPPPPADPDLSKLDPLELPSFLKGGENT